MRIKSRLSVQLAASVLFFLVCGCAVFRNKGDDANTASLPVAVSQGEDIEASLRAIVRMELDAEAAVEKEGGKPTLHYASPYYYREATVFPKGTDSFEFKIRETDSLTNPYNAEVSVDKMRLFTKMHRSKNSAMDDSTLFRSTGIQTWTYAFRNGHWAKVGGLFIAAKTEENVNGEWVPLKEEVHRALAAEEPQQSTLGKIWTSVFGQ